MNIDRRLKEGVPAELTWETTISADYIGVTERDGVECTKHALVHGLHGGPAG